ncbi:hypothetical protein [Pendulispora albinea]|uniref:Uncharacterized protein n=1 Tax=Pendulispora albinea TaxID=2741071 RepID=A0ABZ2LK25_9BACT
MGRVGAVSLAVLFAFGCKPEFSERSSEVRSLRVLAVRTEPGEWQTVLDPDTGGAKPAAFRALVVTPEGNDTTAPLNWAFCSLPKPLTELNDVTIRCFEWEADYLVPMGTGTNVSAPVPENACRQFGPDVPEDQAYRPADPDVTGGYYQPVRILLEPGDGSLVSAVAKVRIKCGLPGATQEQIISYQRRYHPNTNPSIQGVEALLPRGSQPAVPLESDPNAPPLQVAPGQKFELRVSWPGAPLTDACGDGYCGPTESKDAADPNACAADCSPEKGSGGAERYLAFDQETRQLRELRESMRVSWYTAEGFGSFADDRTGAAENDPTTFASNRFTAPQASGDFPIWVVLRDSRGGVDWKSIRIRVAP